MTEQATTIEPMSLAEIAKEHGDGGVTNREAVFQVTDLAVSYNGNLAIKDVTSTSTRTPSRRSSGLRDAARAR